VTGTGTINDESGSVGSASESSGGGSGSAGGSSNSNGGAILLVAGAVVAAVVAGGVLWLRNSGLLKAAAKAVELGGIAVDEAGNVLQNATILVQQLQDGKPVTVQTTKTGADGSYTLNVPDGDYTITAQFADPLTGETRTVELNISENSSGAA
jgi:hypothetical protein